MKKKYQKRTVGAIVEIPLEKSVYAYAQILVEGEAFFDFFASVPETDIGKIMKAPVLFWAAVFNDVITSMRWKKIGKAPIREDFLVLPMQYIQDPITEYYKIYNPNTGEVTSSTKKACEGLEECSVWEGWSMEERLLKYYENNYTNPKK